MRLRTATVCEKFGIDYIGELHLPANMAFMLHMDKVFGGKGTVDDNGPQKPDSPSRSPANATSAR